MPTLSELLPGAKIKELRDVGEKADIRHKQDEADAIAWQSVLDECHGDESLARLLQDVRRGGELPFIAPRDNGHSPATSERVLAQRAANNKNS